MEAHQEELLGPHAFLCSSSPSIYFDFNSFSTASIRPNCSERQQQQQQQQQPLLMTSSSACSVQTTSGLGQPAGDAQSSLLLTTICPALNNQPFGTSLLISEQLGDSANYEWNNRPKFGQLQLETDSCVGALNGVAETGQLVSQLFAGEQLFNGANENGPVTTALLNYNGEMEKQEGVYEENRCDKYAAGFALGNHHVSTLPTTSAEYISGTNFHEITTNNNIYFHPTYTDQFEPATLSNCSIKEEHCKASEVRSADSTDSKAYIPKKYARKKLKNGAKSDSKLSPKTQQQKRNVQTCADDIVHSKISHPADLMVGGPHPCKKDFDKEETRQLNGQESQLCFVCQKSINDQFILSVNNSLYHAACLKCGVCEQTMDEAPTCFLKDNSLFCKTCYLQKYQTKCISCNRQIQATDWVRRARSSLYHLACFSCDHCKRQLSTGEQFSIQESRLLCKQHYMELIQGDDSHNKQKTKRVRTTFAEEQIGILQAHFQIDCNPDGSDLERIANLTGLSKRVTQVWFQNSRARQKKYQGTKKYGRSASGISGGSGGTADSFGASMNSGHSSPASNNEGNTEDGMIFPTSVTTSTDDITFEDHQNLSNLENTVDSDNYREN